MSPLRSSAPRPSGRLLSENAIVPAPALAPQNRTPEFGRQRKRATSPGETNSNAHILGEHSSGCVTAGSTASMSRRQRVLSRELASALRDRGLGDAQGFAYADREFPAEFETAPGSWEQVSESRTVALAWRATPQPGLLVHAVAAGTLVPMQTRGLPGTAWRFRVSCDRSVRPPATSARARMPFAVVQPVAVIEPLRPVSRRVAD